MLADSVLIFHKKLMKFEYSQLYIIFSRQKILSRNSRKYSAMKFLGYTVYSCLIVSSCYCYYYLICQSRLGGTACTRVFPENITHNTNILYTGTDTITKHKYNNKTQIQQEENTKTKNYNNHTVKLKIKYNKKTNIGHNETLVNQESI